MKKSWQIDRRTLLRGAGVACFLPQLEAMSASKAKGEEKIRKKACFVFTPNGCSTPSEKNKSFKDWSWHPHGEGEKYQMTKVHEAMRPLRERLTYFGGLSHPSSRDLLGHIAGDTYLTGGDVGGSEYKNTVSLDQVMEKHLCKDTRQSSMILSCDGGVGYKSRVSTLSFDENGQAIPTENNPRLIFERFFSVGGGQSLAQRRKRLGEGKRVVDLVLEDAKALSRRLGKNDQEKMDQYLASVSDVEDRIARAEQWLNVPMKKVDAKHINFDVKQTDPENYIRAMYDLIVMGFETDVTRVASYMVSREDGMGFGDAFPQIALGFKKGHHAMSHDRSTGSAERWGQLDQFFMNQYAYFLKRLSETKDTAGGSLLDNTMVLHGATCSNTHNARNYPLLLAGGENMGIKHGRRFQYDEKTPLSNLYLSMLRAAGIKAKKFSDSATRKDFSIGMDEIFKSNSDLRTWKDPQNS